MSSSKNYYKYLDFIRLLSCIAILFYHLNILKGGYLAVCTFFVLSGYLSYMSASKQDNFSFKKYYLNKILKIYLPLILVVFITISIVTFISNINWLNLKPETTSIVLGYNNFWQLNANLDYFARHINSPFIHFWYIAILLQFDLIFPFIYLLLRKVGDRFHKIIPCIITFLPATLFTIYFYYSSLQNNIMFTYYNTFTRIFSILFGLSLGVIHLNYNNIIPTISKKENINKLIFYLYFVILICLFIFIESTSKYFSIAMILTTIISCRLIDYSLVINNNKVNIFEKTIKNLSKLSYIIYLVQYPVIFIFQYIKLYNYIKLPLIILITFIVSYLLYFCLNNKNNKLKYVLTGFIIGLSLFGEYKYFNAKDHTKEMKKLEEQLAQNQDIIKEKQQEYEKQLKQEQEDWMNKLNELDNTEKALKDVVTNLNIVGIGDSVMLGAVNNLYQKFPNSYFDAQISRTAWVANGILTNLKNKNILGEPIIINLGTNGDCSTECKKNIINTCENRKVFWITVTNDSDVYVNNELKNLEKEYDNLYIIDWNLISHNHPEYFIADKIHLTSIGREVYTQTIYDSIYQVYLNEFNTKKNEILNEYNNNQKNKITFYGNDLLTNSFDYIKDEFANSNFIINKDFNYETLKQEINNSIANESITQKIVFVLDSTSKISNNEYNKLVDIIQDKEIYLVSVDKNINIIYENVNVIDFYKEIKENNNYLMPDKIHLTDKGNKALTDIIKNILTKESEK